MQVLQQRAFFNSTDLPTGFLFSPLAQPVGSQPCSSDAVPQCIQCGGYANVYTEYTYATASWRCNFCGHGSTSEVPLVQDAVHAQHADFDVIPWHARAALEQQPQLPAWPDHVLLVIDATLDEDLLADVVSGAQALIHTLPPETHLSLLSCDSCVSVFDLSAGAHSIGAPAAAAPQDTVRSVVLPGSEAATAAMATRLLVACPGAIAQVSTCAELACAALATIRPYQHARAARERGRCLGPALEATLHLCQQHRQRAGAFSSDAGGTPAGPLPAARVVAVLGGPATAGPGTVPTAVLDGAGTAAQIHARAEADASVRLLAARMAEAGAQRALCWWLHHLHELRWLPRHYVCVQMTTVGEDWCLAHWPSMRCGCAPYFGSRTLPPRNSSCKPRDHFRSISLQGWRWTSSPAASRPRISRCGHRWPAPAAAPQSCKKASRAC